jgi:NAD(P)H dehydrogenase (quinone)
MASLPLAVTLSEAGDPPNAGRKGLAAELTEALGRKIVFLDVPVDEYCRSLEAFGVPAYVVQHFGEAMIDYQHGHMRGRTTTSKS